MTQAVTASILARITAQYAVSPPIGGATQQVNEVETVAYSPGNGAAGLSDRLLTLAIDIAASGSLTVDLATQVDAFGVAFNPADIQAVYVEADATNTNSIVVGDAGANPFVGPFDAGTDTYKVPPGGFHLYADPLGWAVGSGVNLKLANSGAGSAVTGQLIIVGRSA
jgi:hypothetical protein